MSAKRIVRMITGCVLLAIFAVYSYMRNENWTKSSDLAPHETEKMTIELPQESEKANEPEKEPEPTPTPEPTPDPASPEGKALARGLPAPPEIDTADWKFMLVNGDNSIDQYTPPEVVLVSTSQCPVDSRIAEPIMAFAEDAMAQGLPVYLSSGYRSYSEQYANFIRICNNNGISDGKDADGHYITMPAGCSEHQSGLCCDITDVYRATKKWQDVEPTETFQYMVTRCADFGFILRFPQGKEDITGVMYEPWHYRYVGVEAAKYITENGLTLEEFLELYNGQI